MAFVVQGMRIGDQFFAHVPVCHAQVGLFGQRNPPFREGFDKAAGAAERVAQVAADFRPVMARQLGVARVLDAGAQPVDLLRQLGLLPRPNVLGCASDVAQRIPAVGARIAH